jgi:NAD(P)-dependent dehydrogenase (short-subunit alcohol dehydrogenase family)
MSLNGKIALVTGAATGIGASAGPEHMRASGLRDVTRSPNGLLAKGVA